MGVRVADGYTAERRRRRRGRGLYIKVGLVAGGGGVDPDGKRNG